MTLEEILNRQAVALERIANVLERQENVKEAVAPKAPVAPTPKAAPVKKLPPAKEEAKVEVKTEQPASIENVVATVDPAVKAEAPTVEPVAKAETPSPLNDAFNPAAPAAKTEVSVQEVITALRNFSISHDETQAFSILNSFKVKKVSELTAEQREQLIKKIDTINKMEL